MGQYRLVHSDALQPFVQRVAKGEFLVFGERSFYFPIFCLFLCGSGGLASCNEN